MSMVYVMLTPLEPAPGLKNAATGPQRFQRAPPLGRHVL